MGNVSMEASQINYRGDASKKSVEQKLKETSGEAAAIAQLQTDVGNLQTTKANQITIAPFFSAETAYDPGDLVYYNGLTYRCVNAHEGEWDADDFAATTISTELDTLNSCLTNTNNLIGTLINTMYDGQSIDLDNPTRTTLGLFNGDNITGTKPFTTAGGMGHVVMVYHSNPDCVIEIIMSPYESKMGMRVKEYNQGAWTWQAWKVATFQSVS